jgi:dUTP pyrophosphatase
MDKVKVLIKTDNELPTYGSEKAAGFDFKADFTGKNETTDFIGEGFHYSKIQNQIIVHAHGGRVLIPTGVRIGLPDGYELQVRPRSGLALKNGISVLNTPGTVDSDYYGFIGIILLNTGKLDFVVNEGDRIAQGVLKRVEQVEWVKVDTVEELGQSQRGENGFGSTGKN